MDDPMVIILFRYAIGLLYRPCSLPLLLKHLETWPASYVPSVKA